ncbi:MAG: hypothetical protein ACRBF0_25080 [Calditrichia bacterium]
MKINLRFTFLLIGSFLIQAATAQSLFHADNRRAALNYEFLRPAIDFNTFLDLNDSASEINSGLFSTAHFVNVHLRINRTTMFVGELPIGHAKFSAEGSNEDFSETKVGNPYVGLQLGGIRQPTLVEFGARIPIIDEVEVGHAIGLFSDIIDRFEAFAPNAFPLRVMINTRLKNRRNGGFLHIGSGATAFIDLAGEDEQSVGEGTQFHLINGVTAGIENKRTKVGISYNSRWFITQDKNDPSNQFFHLVGAQLQLNYPTISPFIGIRKPLNEDYSDFVNTIFSLGFRLTQSRR